MTAMCIPLTQYGLLKISGTDAKKLLQGQLTCNLEKLKANESMLGAHCNPQGRIISFFRLFQHQDDYYLFMPRSMVPIALTALKKYAVFYKVALSDANDTTITGYVSDVRPEHIDAIYVPSQTPRYLLIGNHTMDTEANDWHALDIQDGVPAIYPETSQKFLPHEINLPALHAVNFEKGCYTGQEIIARMQYRGKLKTHLVNITSHKNFHPGEENKRGCVVDSCDMKDHYQLLIITKK